MSIKQEIKVILGAEDTGVSDALGNLDRQTSSLADRLKSGIGFGAMAKIGSAAISAVGGGLVSLASSALTAGNNFSATMSEVSAISGAAGSDLDALTAKAKEMGATTKFTASEAGDALRYMAMAGWKTEEMLSGLDGIMNLAAASGEDLGLTSDIVTDALTAFGLAASDSSHFADILASASSNANTNVALLGESFKYVAPVAGALGYSAEDTSVALGLMANAGIKGSQAGTALRSTLSRLAKPTDQVAGAMDALGISITDSNGQMKRLDTLMGDLRHSFSSLTEAQSAEYAATLAGQEGMSGLLAIVNATEADYNKLSAAITNCDGVSKSMADTMQNNLPGKMTIMSSAMESLGIAAYSHVEKPFSDAVDTATKSIGKLTKSMESGGLGKAVEGVGKMVKSTTKAACKALDMVAEHGEDLTKVIVGLGGAWAGIKAANSINTWTKALKSVSGPLGRFNSLTSAGFSKTNALIGVLRTSGGAFAKLGTAANNAGGGVLGLVNGISSMINPVGLVVAGVGVAAGAIAAYAYANRDAIIVQTESKQIAEEMGTAYKELSETLADNRKERQATAEAAGVEAQEAEILAAKIADLAGQESLSASQKSYLISMIEHLNEIMPGLNLSYDEERGALNLTNEAIGEKIRLMKEEAEVAAWRAAQQSVLEDQATATRELSKAQAQLGELESNEATARRAYNDAARDYLNASAEDAAAAESTLRRAKEEWEQSSKAVLDAKSTVNEYKAEIRGLENEYQTFDAYQMQLSAKEGWETLVEEARSAGVQIPESFTNAIEDGAVMVPATMDELKACMQWESLVDDAREKGVEIPTELAAGMRTGAADPQAAVEYLQTVLSEPFQALVQKAEDAGVEIPAYISEGIRTGSVDPQAAMSELQTMLTDYEPAKAAAAEAGLGIPSFITAGLNDGSLSVQQAADYLNSMVDFADMATRAKESGYEVPPSISEGIQNGLYHVDEATEEVKSRLSGQLSDSEFAYIFGASVPRSVAGGMTNNMNLIKPAATGLKEIAIQQMQAGGPEASKAGKSAGTGFSSGLSGTIGKVKTAADSIKKGVTSAAKADAEMKSNGTKAGSGFASGVSSQTGAARSAGSSLKSAANGGSAGGYQSAYSNGQQIGRGFADGMESLLGRIKSAASQMVNAASGAVQAKAMIASPSKLFRGYGEYVGEGFAIGIESTMRMVEKASAALVSLPAAAMPSVSTASIDSMSLTGNAGDCIITVSLPLDGREIAKGTARFTKAEIAKMDRLEAQMKGAF